MELKIFCNREDAKKIEEEERNLFIKSILEEMGIDLEEIWPEVHLTIEQKIKLRKELEKFNVFILDNRDGSMEIYVEDYLAAKWNIPKYVFKIDHSVIDPSKKIFYEMTISADSVFEENTEEN